MNRDVCKTVLLFVFFLTVADCVEDPLRRGTRIPSENGLTLELSAHGAVTGVVIDGNPLPASDAVGGICIADVIQQDIDLYKGHGTWWWDDLKLVEQGIRTEPVQLQLEGRDGRLTGKGTADALGLDVQTTYLLTRPSVSKDHL